MSDLDKQHIQRSFGDASKSYDAMAHLQRRVGCELMRLSAPVSKGRVLDIGCGTGFLTEKLQKYDNQLVALDIAEPMLFATRQRLDKQTAELVCADAEQLPFAALSFQQIYSNLALQWCRDLEALFSDVHRCLKPEGALFFSTFGKHALAELKQAWAEVDAYPHVNDFCDKAEIEQALKMAGFIDIDIVEKKYIHEYETVMSLMRELKAIGAHNVNQQRQRSLTSKGQLQKMLAAYPNNKAGKIDASFEIFYIQAKKGSD